MTMFNILDLLDSTIKEALRANSRCSVKHTTAQSDDMITYISISRSLSEEFIPKTSLVLDQEEHGKNTTVSLNYLDADNFLELNIFFDDDSCFKGIIIYADNGEPVHELASKIANNFIASGKSAIFPLLERADIQAANKSKVTHTTISSTDNKIVTQMSIAKGLTANDKRKMTVVLIQDKDMGSTIFSVEFIEETDIICNIFLSDGTSYQEIKIKDEDPAVCRTFAWKLINGFIEHGEDAFLDILPKPEQPQKSTVKREASPTVNLYIYRNNDFSNNVKFEIESKSNEKLQKELCEKLADPKERETAIHEFLLAIESKDIEKDNSLLIPNKASSVKNSRYLFLELKIEVPTSYEDAVFLTLCRSDKLKLRFRLSGRKSINARARQLLDMIDAFIISPEKLALCHDSLLVDDVCPTSVDNLLRLTNLYHCNRKLAAENSKVSLSCDDVLDVTFTRYKKNGCALNLELILSDYQLEISVTEKRYFFSRTRKFTLPTDFLDIQENINSLFVSFYNDKNGSIDKCGLKNSLLVYFLQSRSQVSDNSTDNSLLIASLASVTN